MSLKRLPVLKIVIKGLTIEIASQQADALHIILSPGLDALAAIGVQDISVSQYESQDPTHLLAFIQCDLNRHVISTRGEAVAGMPLALQAVELNAKLIAVATHLVH